MAPPDSLARKIARNPLRFGLIAGFLGVPLLWMMGENLVHLALGQPTLPAEAFWNYEASGALIGAFLGGQGIRIWASWRAGRIAAARGIAFFTGASGLAFYVACAFVSATNSAGRSQWLGHGFDWPRVAFFLWSLVITLHLPFLLCLLLLMGALFAPRR